MNEMATVQLKLTRGMNLSGLRLGRSIEGRVVTDKGREGQNPW